MVGFAVVFTVTVILFRLIISLAFVAVVTAVAMVTAIAVVSTAITVVATSAAIAMTSATPVAITRVGINWRGKDGERNNRRKCRFESATLNHKGVP